MSKSPEEILDKVFVYEITQNGEQLYKYHQVIKAMKKYANQEFVEQAEGWREAEKELMQFLNDVLMGQRGELKGEFITRIRKQAGDLIVKFTSGAVTVSQEGPKGEEKK